MKAAVVLKNTLARAILFGFCAVGVLALVPWSLSEALLRQTIIRQIELATGLKAEEIGHATLSILPQLTLRCENVALRDKDGAISIEAKAIQGNLRLLSLVTGRLELKSLTLDTPTIFVDLDGHPFERAGSIALAFQAAAGSPQADEADRARLASLTINSGLLRVQSRSLQFETLVQDVDATLDWQRVGNPALLSGGAVWRGRAAQFELAAAKPSALLRGDPSNVTIRVRGDAANIDADGILSGSGGPRFDGSVKAETHSLRELARMLKFSISLPGPLDEAWIDGDVKIARSNIAINNAKFGLDGNAFEGSLAMLAVEDRVAVSGTLATERLQLDPIAAQMPVLRGIDGQWSRDHLELGDLSRDDLDLRISAGHVRLGSFQAEDAAVSVMVRKGRIEVSLDEAQAYQGAVKLRAIGMIDGPKLDLKVGGNFNHVDIGALMAAAGLGGWLSGTGSGEFLLTNTGDNPAGLIDNLSGHVAIRIAEGAIKGINVEQALRRVERKPLLSASDVHTGTTSFDVARLDARIDKGNLSIADGAILGPGALIAFSGGFAFADGAIDISARAAQTGADGGKRIGGPELSFDVTGSWDDLRVEPDAESLIRRSNAAAPLFVLRPSGLEPVPASNAARAP